MTEGELRVLVRDVIARHAAASDVVPPTAPPIETPSFRQHLSHAMFRLADGASIDGPCVIEPDVTCNHCGYCKSYGH